LKESIEEIFVGKKKKAIKGRIFDPLADALKGRIFDPGGADALIIGYHDSFSSLRS
jgi:hypothetical protein